MLENLQSIEEFDERDGEVIGLCADTRDMLTDQLPEDGEDTYYAVVNGVYSDDNEDPEPDWENVDGYQVY